MRRWKQREEGGLPEYACFVPSESLNGFSVVHLDEGRRVHPLLPIPDAWQNTLPEGLYRQWLSIMPDFSEMVRTLLFRGNSPKEKCDPR